MSLDELQSSLLVHEQRMQGHVVEEQALKITYDNNVSKPGRGGGTFRGRGRGRGRQGFDKSLVECFYCHNLGHFQNERPKKGKESQAHYAETTEPLLLMAYVDIAEMVSQRKESKGYFSEPDTLEVDNCTKELLLMARDKKELNETTWFLDSGCSNHMCGHKEFFLELDESFRKCVKLGDNSSIGVMGKGRIHLQIDHVSQIITEVFYIPELKNNLLSIGQLQEKGLAILFQYNKCKVYHPERGLIIETTMSLNKMFILLAKIQLQDQHCFLTPTQNLDYLWHCRYGHLSFGGLKTLQQKQMVHGLPKLQCSSLLCEDCVLGKQHRSSFPQESMWRASQPLQLLHSDICGPISPISNSHKRYLLTFIDDFSRKIWVFFLKEKSEAFRMFQLFKTKVEKETGASIRGLRTDRGGEFTSTEFIKFCATNGIHRQLTAAYTPQQNGVAERKNRTIMNMVRSLLNSRRVPKKFWPEAVNYAVHILNRSPTLAVRNKTPEEAWSGTKPSVAHFRVFGCLSYAHVPDCKRTKLDNKSLKCVLLGISEESKAYRLYDPLSQKVLISRDVIFNEEESWTWDDSYVEAIQTPLDWSDVNDNNKNNIQDEAVDNNSGGTGHEEGSGSVSGGTGHEEGSESVSVDNRFHEENVEYQTVEEHTSADLISSPAGRRSRHPPIWMCDYDSGEGLSDDNHQGNFALFVDDDPLSYKDAAQSAKWRYAMDSEIEAIRKNDTWDLTDLPRGAKTVGVKWVYKTKLNEHGEVDKYKARLFAKGYTQQHGVDYTEVFAPVARMDTIRLVLALVAQKGWPLFQLDVKSAFLHGELKEEVYVEQPPGYVVKGAEKKVYRLRRALYGLKQAPRAWYSRIEAYFLKEGFEKCPYEHTLFLKKSSQGMFLLVCLYVDDLIFTGNDETLFRSFKHSMMKEFDMTDLGRMRYFLGLEVLQRSDGIFVCQKKYAQEVLERFNMADCNAVFNPIVPGFKLDKDSASMAVDNTLYMQMVGSLMYLTSTRPDIMFVVSLLSRYLAHPTDIHLQAVKRVLRYIKGTLTYGIFYKQVGNKELLAYTDSDYAGDLEDRKSTSGFLFSLSSAAVSWSSKKQPVVTLSTTEAEFIAAASCACQAVWLRRILENLNHASTGATVMYCDNSSTIKLSRNPVMHGRSKHIDVRFHFLRNLTQDGVVTLLHCRSQDQLADIMTKPLTRVVFEKLRMLMGVCQEPGVN